MARTDKGFTLIELLVVVAIISILAAIAVPNFLEAQTRSKVAATKNNLRVGQGALEVYRVDHNRYPNTGPFFPEDPLAILASSQLNRLSTPIAYLTSSQSLIDPFSNIQLVIPASLNPSNSGGFSSLGDRFPELNVPNEQKSLLYFHYPSLSKRLAIPALDINAASLVSLGPDLEDSLGAYGIFPDGFLKIVFGPGTPAVNTVYDPTNGTISGGDIASFAGFGNRFK